MRKKHWTLTPWFIIFAAVMLLMAFAFSTKTIFIRLLGVEYNGVNGLFSNILSILALSELGIGNVLNYTLYRALKQHNEIKISSLVLFFKKVYRIIAFAVLGVGLFLVPLLPYIVSSTIPQQEIVVYYLLYLLNSVVSYFVVYKTTVIIADQNNYISNICETITTLAMYMMQIFYLLLFKNFLGYLMIQVLCTITKNIVLNLIADRKYPYLRHLDRSLKLEDEDKQYIYSNIKATFLYKVAGVIVNNTDNILISVLVGTVFVGYYSNYSMIIGYIASFVAIFISGITASLGNLNAEENVQKSYDTFQMMVLIFNFIGTITSSCLLTCLQGFISIWIGPEHVMPMAWILVIVFNNYLSEVMSPVWMFRETMGLFQQVKYVLLITAVLNIVFSICFGLIWGVPGILLATAVSKLAYQYWYEPKLLFENKFHLPLQAFLKNQLKQAAVCVIAVVISWYACSFIDQGLTGLLCRAMVSGGVSVIVVFTMNRKSNAWKMLNDRYIRRIAEKISRK